jgi:hypothetical protein
MALLNTLPTDTQIVEEIDANGNKAYYAVYSLSRDLISEGLTYRYKVDDLKTISDTTGVVKPDVVVNLTEDGIEIVSGSFEGITEEDYNNSFYFGNVTQLSAISGNVEVGAESYDFLIEALEQESKYKPYLMSTDAKGRYDYLAVVIEAALEGRTARESELAQTTWWKTHTATERQEMLFAHQDPATFSQRGIKKREDIISRMMAAGITELDPKVIDAITQKYQYGTFTDDDITKTLQKLANPLIRYTLDPEVKAALEGKTLETIELTRQMENTINSILGPGVADNYNLDQLLANYQDNPTAFTQEFLPKLQDQFQAKFTQYAGTNVKAYEDIAPEFRREWQNITGAAPDERSAQWNQFIATNDVAERKDIAFAAAAETGSQTYRDQFKSDMERVFGKAGARSTGGGRFGL